MITTLPVLIVNANFQLKSCTNILNILERVIYIDYKAKFLSLVINIFPTKVLQLESFVVTMLFWVYLFKSHPLLTS